MELIEDWILCDGMKIKEIISSSEYTKLDKKIARSVCGSSEESGFQ